MTKPKITVIMTAYNSSKYIDEAISSILNQTFKEFELIVVNDCSTDSTPDIVKQYADRDQRVILLNNPVNLKPALSRNKALEIARGEYVAILDSDDLALPDRLKEQYDYLEKHPDVALVGCAAEIIDDNGTVLGRKRFPTDFNEIKFMMLLRNPFIHSGILVRRRAMAEFGYSNEHLHSEDYKLYSDLTRKYRITNLSDILMKYRRSAGSVTLEQESRRTQLSSANKVHWELINRYLPISFAKTGMVIETIQGTRNDLLSALKTVLFYRRLVFSYIEKEQPDVQTRKDIWNVYIKDKEMVMNRILYTHMPKLYFLAKKIYLRFS